MLPRNHSGLHHRHAAQQSSNNNNLLEDVDELSASGRAGATATAAAAASGGIGVGGLLNDRSELSGRYRERTKRRHGSDSSKTRRYHRGSNGHGGLLLPLSSRKYPTWLVTTGTALGAAALVAVVIMARNHYAASSLKKITKGDLMSLVVMGESQRARRSQEDQQELFLSQQQQHQAASRAQQRRTQTRPPPASIAGEDEDSPPPPPPPDQGAWLLPDHNERPTHPFYLGDGIVSLQDSMKPVNAMDDLCGYLAQSASLSHPRHYLQKHVLSPESRVIITGVLNPVGYHLALALQERCGVENIVGVDAIYPNTFPHRMAMQEPLQVLTSNLPKLAKPLLVPLLGIDPPKLNKKGLLNMETTGELDWMSFEPTHIVHMATYSPDVFSNALNWDWRNMGSPYVADNYDPPLYAIRQSMTAMEQLLASIAAAPPKQRPVLVYASSNVLETATAYLFRRTSVAAMATAGSRMVRDDLIHAHTKLMDEVLADTYYTFFGVNSLALRLPNAIYGRWGHACSEVHQVLKQTCRGGSDKYSYNYYDHRVNFTTNDEARQLDLVWVDDVVDAILAAMQFYHPKPIALELGSGGLVSAADIEVATLRILQERGSEQQHQQQQQQQQSQPSRAAVELQAKINLQTSMQSWSAARQAAARFLTWNVGTKADEGLIRAMSWHLDRANPYGPPLSHQQQQNDNAASSLPLSMQNLETGDELLSRFNLDPCKADDLVCHAGHKYMPCASECNIRKDCTPSVFDSIIPLVRDVTEGCDIVLYTQALGRRVLDLKLPVDYVEDGEPSLCNFAFVSTESRLVQSVVQKVPDGELARLGVVPSPEDQHKPGAFRERKVVKLNGRLLYKGWILIWANEPSEEASAMGNRFAEEMLLKLSPGKLFHQDVKHAIFVDQLFAISPKPEDIRFLVSELHRPAWGPRIVKRKTRPKAKFLLPAEPERQAVILMSELKFQEAADSERLPSGEKITVFEATRFMRFEMGDEPKVTKESLKIKAQREFYERIPSFTNRDFMKSGSEPAYKFEMGHWARSRWVLHDLRHEESRQLRCDWYQEHLEWESEIDQLSFAYVMARRDVERRIALNEPDDNVLVAIDEKTQMKRLLSDAFEWTSLKTPQNKLYTPFEEMRMLPYEMDYPEEGVPQITEEESGKPKLLFARIISDRIMAYARQTWNDVKAADEAARLAAEEAEREKAERVPRAESAARAAEQEAAAKLAAAREAQEAATIIAAEAAAAAKDAQAKSDAARKIAEEKAEEERRVAAGESALSQIAIDLMESSDAGDVHRMGPDHAMGGEDGTGHLNKDAFGTEKDPGDELEVGEEGAGDI